MANIYCAWDISLRVVCILSVTLLDKNVFFFLLERFSFGDSMDGNSCLLPISVLRDHLAWTYAGCAMLPQALWVHMFIRSVMYGRHSFLGVRPHLCWPYNLLASSAEFPEPWRKGFNEGIPFMTEYPKLSHSAHCSVERLYWFPSNAGGSSYVVGRYRHCSTGKFFLE